MYRLLDRVMFTRGLKPGLCLFKLPVVCGTFPRPCASWLDAMDVRHSSQRERVPSISHVPVFNTKNVYDLLVSSLSNCGDPDYVRRHKINDDVIHNQRSILLEKRQQQHHLLQRNSASQCVRGSRCLSTSCHRHALPPTLPAAAGVSSAVPSQLLFPDVPTIQVAEFVISSAYHITGLPWWSTIVLTAFVVRILLMMPLTIYTHHNMARLQRLAPEVKEVAERLRLEVSVAMQKLGWDQQKARQEYNKNMNRLLRELHIRDNCHPMKNTASFWLQIPLWISVSYALRNMSVKAVNPELDELSQCARSDQVQAISDVCPAFCRPRLRSGQRLLAQYHGSVLGELWYVCCGTEHPAGLFSVPSPRSTAPDAI
ncbi:uncharacterized protein LOC101845255 isoform X2 [Aplysia californica]|uniref:Uncharacterized protein LOC101845255 isoform X2 n=1 Tax=Aplysia californica TaxID=6500 RepID=A0ABM1A4E9_APLCA|nr:uncharacterized protein LOC101845255 isoform X2 [Aplysia californica]